MQDQQRKKILSNISYQSIYCIENLYSISCLNATFIYENISSSLDYLISQQSWIISKFQTYSSLSSFSFINIYICIYTTINFLKTKMDCKLLAICKMARCVRRVIFKISRIVEQRWNNVATLYLKPLSLVNYSKRVRGDANMRKQQGPFALNRID